MFEGLVITQQGLGTRNYELFRLNNYSCCKTFYVFRDYIKKYSLHIEFYRIVDTEVGIIDCKAL